MEHVAILVDGTAEPVRNVDFPTRRVGQARRPLGGLAIALLTAGVTMGAMGPRASDSLSAAACGPDATSAAGHDLVATGDRAAPRTTPTPWWLLPSIPVWVDQATGRFVQGDPHDAEQVVDHRRRDR